MKEEVKKRKRVMKAQALTLSLAVVLGLALIIGTSYAVFTVTASGQNESKVTIGNFDIQFQEETGSTLTLSNERPLRDSQGLSQDPYTFTITNQGTIDAKYRIYLEGKTEEENQLAKNYLKLGYNKSENAPTIVKLADLDESMTLASEVTLPAGKSDTWNLRFWLDYAATNQFQGKNYSFKVVVESVQDVSTKVVGESPIIYLAEGVDQVGVGESYVDPGIQNIVDEEDGILPSAVVTKRYEFYNPATEELLDLEDAVTATQGVLFIHYQASDSDGNITVATRVVTVGTPSSETISLNGDALVEVALNETYTELGCTASTSVKVLNTPNVFVKGNYVVKYIVQDANGLAKGAARIVKVK